MVERIRAYDNELTGIGVTSEGALIRGNVALDNGTNGIRFSAGSTVLSNVANNNGNDGFDGFCDSTVMFNTAIGNSVTNLDVIGGTAACVIEHNTAP